jgi:Domain of unknown function (DUF4407)
MTVERILVWCSGANYGVLQNHLQDELPFLWIGSAVLASAVLAGTAAVALLQLFSGVPLAGQVPLALLAAVVSAGLDRFLVAVLLRPPRASRGTYVATLIPRALLGAVSAVCVATLIVTHLATLDVDRQIAANQQQNSGAFFAALDKSKLAEDISSEQEFVAALKRPDERVQNLEVQLQYVQLQEKAALGNYYCLRYGGPCTIDLAAAEQQQQEYKAAVSQASQISSMISSQESKDAAAAGPAQAKLPAAESQLASNRASETKLTTSFLRSNSDPGLLARLRAIAQVSDRGWARVGGLVLLAFFLLVACLPVLLRIRLDRKPLTGYDGSMAVELARKQESRSLIRKEAMLEAWRDGGAAARPAIQEIRSLLEQWERSIPATRRDVKHIGARLTNALTRDWKDRRRRR